MSVHRGSFPWRSVLPIILAVLTVIDGAVLYVLIAGEPTSLVGPVTGGLVLVVLVGSLFLLNHRLESRHRMSEQYPKFRYSQGNYTLGGAFFFSGGLMMLVGVLLSGPPNLWPALAIYASIAGVLMAIGAYWLSIAQRMYQEATRSPS